MSNPWKLIDDDAKTGEPVIITAMYGVRDDGTWFGSIPVVAKWFPASHGFDDLWVSPDERMVYGALTVLATHYMPMPIPPE